MRAVTAAFFVYVLSFALPEVQSALVYSDTPPAVPGADQIWLDSALPSPAGEGNGLTFTPNEEIIILTKGDGVLIGYDPLSDGGGNGGAPNKFFEFDPAAVMENVTNATCKSSVSFPGSNETYLVYAITAFYSNDNKNYGVVVAVDYSKTSATMRWHSAFGDLGAVEGTPKASSTGTEVYLTHNNADESQGTFTVLDDSNDGAILYSEPNPKNDNNKTSAYGELGIYHEPDEGWYDGGDGNENDIVIWSHKNTANGAGGLLPGQGGGTWAFQLPADGSRNTTEFAATFLQEVGWKTSTAPIIFFNGRGLCFAVSQSKLRCWYPGNPDDPDTAGNRNKFSAAASGTSDLPPRAGGGQGYLEPRATPMVGGDDASPNVYSAGASTSFYGFDVIPTATNQLSQLFKHNDTVVDVPIWSSARLGADEKRIFFVTQSGKIVCADPLNNDIYWEYVPLGAPEAKAQFTLSPDGTQLIGSATVGGQGFVSAIKIATTANDTEAPTEAPSQTPQPSMPPSEMPSSVPSAEPSNTPGPSMTPSDTPVPTKTVEPSYQPSQVPSTAPSETPIQGATTAPSVTPSQQPSSKPSQGPSEMPGERSSMPSDMPSSNPSNMPSDMPSNMPSDMPSKKPTAPTSSAPWTEQFGLLGMILAMVVGVFVLPLH